MMHTIGNIFEYVKYCKINVAVDLTVSIGQFIYYGAVQTLATWTSRHADKFYVQICYPIGIDFAEWNDEARPASWLGKRR